MVDLGSQKSFDRSPTDRFKFAAVLDQITTRYAGLSDLPLAEAVKFFQRMLHTTLRACLIESAYFAHHCLILSFKSIDLAFN